MKKTIIKNGLISSLIVCAAMATSMALMKNGCGSTTSMMVGYASMLVAFIFIFVAVKSYRDKENGGVITFWTGLKIGLLISLIASTCYVVTWAIEYKYFMPDFMTKYAASAIAQIKASGQSQAIIDAEIKKTMEMQESYKNPVYFTMITYSEILPVGILVSVISAWIFKRKVPVAA